MLPAVGALLLGGVSAAGVMVGYYFNQGVGMGRTAYRDIIQEKGGEIKFLEEAAMGLGVGIAEMLSERVGLGSFLALV